MAKYPKSIGMVILTLILSCSEEDKDAPLAELTTTEVTEITYSSAKSGGIIISDGGATVTARGVCWGITPSPTIEDNKTIDGAGGGTFTSSLTGLSPNTNYFVRAYATNSNGTAYGISYSFATEALVLPDVNTAEVTAVTYTSALSGGNATADGGSAITSRGVCWSTSSNPTILNSKTSDGSGGGEFVSTLNGLTAGTDYYLRAYVTNSVGTAYGSEVQFRTYDSPELSTGPIVMSTMSSILIKGNIINAQGNPLTKGICWGLNLNPTVNGNKTSDQDGIGEFQNLLTGLIPGTKYYLRAYVTNEIGTTYGNEVEVTTSSFINEPTDIDGNVYTSVQIGTQIWMAQNLKTTKYANGDVIQNVTDASQWSNLSSGAWVNFNNNPTNDNIYGKLYNWYTVTDARKLCPSGWHVPSDGDYDILRIYLSEGEANNCCKADLRLKEAGNVHWFNDYNGPATNESGFTGLPGGKRFGNSGFEGINSYGNFWTTTTSATIANFAESYSLHSSNGSQSTLGYNSGASVRCIKD